MTTIAYHNETNTVAIDGMTTAGDQIVSLESRKWIETELGVWFFCGATGDYQGFFEDFEPYKKSRVKFDCSCIYAKKGGSAFLRAIDEDGNYWEVELDCDRSIGSGSHYALAAMKCGKDAAGAVAIASTLDTHTGGLIRAFDVASGEFKSIW